MTHSDDNPLTIIEPSDSALAHVGQVANHYAAQNVFTDYLSRKADNTIRRQAADLARFVEFLHQIGEQAGVELGAALDAFARTVGTFPGGPAPDADAWHGVTWGLVEAFRNWMVARAMRWAASTCGSRRSRRMPGWRRKQARCHRKNWP